MRVLQLSDPHLLADPLGLCRGRQPLACLRHGLDQALAQLQPQAIDLLLLTGDLCQDESWGGYARLRDLLADRSPAPVALLAGNHDRPPLLQAALGRQAWIAPAAVPLGAWTVLLLDSHRPGCVGGWIDSAQLAWLEGQLGAGGGPVLVALHHPPVAIGAPALDGIGLRQPGPLLELLRASPRVRGVVFGHIHQHWLGAISRATTAPALQAGGSLPLWGCPSTLAPFEAVQPCPLGHADWPGGRLLELAADGEISTHLLRWPPLDPA
jgi:Icc protein